MFSDYELICEIDNIEGAIALVQSGINPTSEVMDYAVLHGSLSLVNFFHSHCYIPCDHEILRTALDSENVTMINFIVNNIEDNELSILVAIEYRREDILSYLLQVISNISLYVKVSLIEIISQVSPETRSLIDKRLS